MNAQQVKSWFVLVSMMVAVSLGAHPSQPAEVIQHLPVDVDVPMPPTPVKADGKQTLVYELNITNSGTNNLELVRMEILGDRARKLIASYADQQLNRCLKPGILVTVVGNELHYKRPTEQPEHRVIDGGKRTVMYVLIALERKADIPAVLHHRFFFKSRSGVDSPHEVVEGASVAVNGKKPLVLGPPLRGDGWLAIAGPSNDNYHRRAIVVMGGKARIPQRFATDWARIDPDGKPVRSPFRYVDGVGLISHDGDRAKNEDSYAYGAEVLAVANAMVAEVRDGIPENQGGPDKRAMPITPETIAGNYVMLDLGGSNFAFYGHLQPKSIRVRVGERVRRGQILGLLGNSGNSEGPHLHFDVTNGSSLLSVESVPYVFEAFEVQGHLPSMSELGKWKPLSSVKADKRRKEIPVENVVVRFP